MSRTPGQDAEVEAWQAPAKYCQRKLLPGQVKRYLAAPRPLLGYAIACPGCGFIELHMHERHRFDEHEGALAGVAKPPSCMVCGRTITIRTDHGKTFIAATSPAPPGEEEKQI